MSVRSVVVLFVVVTAWTCSAAGRAAAALAVNFSLDENPVSTDGTFNVVAGGTIRLNVFLTQSGTTPFGNGVIGDYRLSEVPLNNGVTENGVGLTFFDIAILGDATADFAGRDGGAIVPFDVGPGFVLNESGSEFIGDDFQLQTFADRDGDFLTVEPVYAAEPFPDFAELISPNDGPIEDNSVFLGTLNLVIPTTSLGTFAVDFSQPTVNQGIRLGNNPDLEGLLVTGSATFNVAAIPEPSSLIGLGGVAVALVSGRRRRFAQPRFR